MVYKDANVVVKAFKVNHGSWQEAYGYRFETAGKVIVVSGDCTYSEALIANAQDCDILVHEVYSMEGLVTREKRWQEYHLDFHNSTAQLADINNKVTPDLLVLTHQLLCGTIKECLVAAIQSNS